MFGGLADLFNFGTVRQPPQAPPAAQQNGNSKTPPASKRILDSLPLVKVTADDILEVTNKECLICLDEQKIGAWACKLQCGHLFHKQCIHEWLEKHCTCPVCRFELETDDASYEGDRKTRMKKRKLRLRMDEINNKSISQLRELSASLNVNIAGCIDKKEVIDKLVLSGFIEITEGQPPLEMTEAEFQAKSVSELKYLLLSFGLSDKDLLYKSELRDKLLDSGRIIFKPPISGDPDTGNHTEAHNQQRSTEKADIPTPPYSNRNTSENTKEEGSDSTPWSSDGRYNTLLTDLRCLSLSEVRELCGRYRVSTAGCIDKAELVERLLDSGHMNILPVELQLEARADYSASAGNADGGPDLKTTSRDSCEMDVCDEAGNNFHTAHPHPAASTSSSSSRSAECETGVTSSTRGSGRSKGINAYDTYTHETNSSNSRDSTDRPPTSPLCSSSAQQPSSSSSSRYSSSGYPDNSSGNNAGAASAGGGGSAGVSAAGRRDLQQEQQQQCFQDDGRLPLSDALLQDMSVRELKSIMQAYGIDGAGCLEKSDMIAKVKESSFVRIVD